MSSTPLPQLMDLMDRAQAFEDLRAAFQDEGRTVSDAAMHSAIFGNASPVIPTGATLITTVPAAPKWKEWFRLGHPHVLIGLLMTAVLGLSGYAFHLHHALTVLYDSQASQHSLNPAQEELLMPGDAVFADDEGEPSRTGEQQPFVAGFTVGTSNVENEPLWINWP